MDDNEWARFADAYDEREILKRLDAMKRKVVDDVTKNGWSPIHVFAGEDTPSVTYTVGFHTTFSHPEIVVMNVPYKAAHSFLSNVAARLRADERLTEPGIEYENIIGNGYKVRFEPTVRDECNLARWHSDDECAVWQMLWPDKAGNFPDEDNYDERMVQPLWTR